MKFFKLRPTDSLYQQAFGNTDIQHFTIYTNQEESIGKIVDVLTDETQRSYYLAVEIGSWLSRKRVILPLSQFHVDSERHRVYVGELTKAEAENLPTYTETKATADNQYKEDLISPPLNSSLSSTPVMPSLEASAPLEASIPVETPAIRQVTSSVVTEPAPAPQVLPRTVDSVQADNPLTVNPSTNPAATVSEEIIRLLEERLVVNRQKRKVGDVIIRKTIETQIVEVPVRRERLIVEQVSPERKQLASIDLNQGAIDRLQLNEPIDVPNDFTHETQAVSVDLANRVLTKLVQTPEFSSTKVKMIFEDPELQTQYEQWLAEHSMQ